MKKTKKKEQQQHKNCGVSTLSQYDIAHCPISILFTVSLVCVCIKQMRHYQSERQVNYFHQMTDDFMNDGREKYTDSGKVID